MGGAHAITGSASLDARLPGQWYQLETGLHYNWHRHYDLSLGRYTQPDPLGFVDGPSVYGYAKGSPLSAVDPDGQQIALPLPPQISIPVAIGSAAIAGCYYVWDKLLKSPPKPRNDEKCERQLAADELFCNQFSKGRSWQRCMSQAMERYAHCLARRPGTLPPLTW